MQSDMDRFLTTIEDLIDFSLASDVKPVGLVVNRKLFEDIARENPEMLNLPQFKTEIKSTVNKVTLFKSSRHENLVLQFDADDDEPAIRIIDARNYW